MSDFDFYEHLPMVSDFGAMARPETYVPVPASWLIGTSDIIGSTKAVAEGRYKTVNMIGAAVISAQINSHGVGAFPFVFGGDGAAFAIPPEWKQASSEALSAVQLWAEEEFGMGLRIGIVGVGDIRNAGYDVRIARYQVSEGMDYAMFSGGGIAWAESRMKAGAHRIARAPAGTQPDLDGLSCRWRHLPAQNGTILSLVMLPQPDVSAADFAGVSERILQLSRGLDRAGHPVPLKGPGAAWLPAGTRLEARAQKRKSSLWRARRKAVLEALFVKTLLVTGLDFRGFDARRYRRVLGENADFRKFDDGLKMTLDCDAATDRAIEAALQEAERAGLVRYGLHRQTEAMITCIVPSAMQDDHMHFIDGAAGGYTAAAKTLRA